MIEKLIKIVPWQLRDSIRRIPVLSQVQRWIFSKCFNGVVSNHRIDAGPADGLVFPIRLPEDKLFWTGTWEIDFAQRLGDLVPQDSVCFDVGGYRGYFAGIMAVRGSSEVHCFEPNPDNCRRIERMVALNPDLSVRLHQVAMGERDDEMEFAIMPDGAMGKLTTSGFQVDMAGERRIKMDVRSVDSMIDAGELPRPALIKVDIEGAEAMFLRGAAECIKRDRPVVLLEYHSGPLAHECAKFLAERSYHIEMVEAGSLDELTDQSVGHFVALPK
jgi:FkbM family methyltransferase